MLTLDGHYGDPAGSPCYHAPRKLYEGEFPATMAGLQNGH